MGIYEELKARGLIAQVTDEEMKTWTEARGYQLVKTSAKTGEGIVAMFRELAEELYRVKGTRGSVTTSPARRDVPQCC